MTKEDEKHFRALYDMVSDCTIRIEALRVTLEQQGLSHEQFEKNLAVLQASWSERFHQSITEYLQNENDRLRNLLLELHEGTKQ
jgi:hypothetical protein